MEHLLAELSRKMLSLSPRAVLNSHLRAHAFGIEDFSLIKVTGDTRLQRVPYFSLDFENSGTQELEVRASSVLADKVLRFKVRSESLPVIEHLRSHASVFLFQDLCNLFPNQSSHYVAEIVNLLLAAGALVALPFSNPDSPRTSGANR